MTKFEFQELLRGWCQDDAFSNDRFSLLKSDIEFLGEQLFDEYKPTKNIADGDFSVRLAKWIGSADTAEDQQSLFLLLRHLFFVGQDDLEAAYRTAFSKHVLEWLISKLNLNVLSAGAEALIAAALSQTRYTRITDSFELPTFLRLNDIQGHNIRYTWEEHLINWDSQVFCDQVMKAGTPEAKKYLVLLEDFVGSGSQASTAIGLAQSLNNPAVEVLFCPLIICPDGVQLANQLQAAHQNFTFSPVLQLNEKDLVKPTAVGGENKSFPRYRDCLTRLYPKVTGPNPGPQDYGPFGYQDTGAIFVKYDNCPDNSLPVLHRKRQGHWAPLFRRASREAI
ncbi:phosphoribosyltransferase-like protein [Parasphingorhabdus sp.]|uniref:phosphoribosyltransferase-like protein n=1 Tax=Parasphingorhabdus sp. TaxID=2709688 RepID=UPI003D2CD0B4